MKTFSRTNTTRENENKVRKNEKIKSAGKDKEKTRKGAKGSTVAYFWHIGASSNKKKRSYVQCVSG